MSTKECTLILPHQLFKQHPAITKIRDIVLVEHPLFFGCDTQYGVAMHKQKIVLHRASMQAYKQYLQRQGYTVEYREVKKFRSLAKLTDEYTAIHIAQVTDYALQKRLNTLAKPIVWYETPGFINSIAINKEYARLNPGWRMQTFYIYQRKRLKILVDEQNEPLGGQWSFDGNNRKKVPATMVQELPVLRPYTENAFFTAAKKYVETLGVQTRGTTKAIYYPCTHSEAEEWLQTFLEQRFAQFGPYEDAIEPGKDMLFHSVLTPLLNIGLLTPIQVVQAAITFASVNKIPIESLEGFIRQVIGWREFMRATYEDKGVKMRTGNFWQHTNEIPESFYSATTGIVPIDDCIQRLTETAYCHHIERLMVLGGFMFLCEINPQKIYRWFMEMFIDSYDWVMVPNVYAMSQNSCGGLITTKPYFSGSAYIKRMSHYKHGDWADTWDALYWTFIAKHAETLRKNPRWAMMCSLVEKMDAAVLQKHLERKEDFFAKLFS